MRLLLLVLAALAACQPEPTAPPVRAMTYNLRFDNPADGVDAWPLRQDWVAQIVQEQTPDLLALQEAVVGQVRFMEEALPGFGRVGVGRDDGLEGGEFSPVYYRKDRFDLLESGTWWLSERPDSAGSRGWDAALPRVATWTRLRDKAAEKDLVFVSTHFDHMGDVARRESARLLVERLPLLAGDAPVILAGDFNVEDTTAAYRTVVTASGEWTDAWIAAGSPLPGGTFTGFSADTPTSAGPRIDYIFARGSMEVTAYQAGNETRKGRRPSDHRWITTDLAWRK